MTNPKPDPLRGAIAGVLAGLAASYAMNKFQQVWIAISPGKKADGDPATVKAADQLDQLVTGNGLPREKKELAGEVVHYGLGAALGLAYGVAAEYRPTITTGHGTAFGAGVALALDEAVVPAVGLGDPAWKTPLSTHVYGMISHLLFGAAAETTRLAVRRIG